MKRIGKNEVLVQRQSVGIKADLKGSGVTVVFYAGCNLGALYCARNDTRAHLQKVITSSQ